MAVSRDMRIYGIKYDSEEQDRPTTASSHKPTTVMKYMSHRTLGLNHLNSFQGSLRNFILSTTGSTSKISPVSTNHGLASLVPSSTLSPIDSINGDRTIDEHHELSKISETLTENILQCCCLDAHNRVQELQIEWLEKNANKNSSIIGTMFRTEMQTAQQLIEDGLRCKPDLEKKLNDIHQTTLANDEYYQQLLSKRNALNKEIFDYQGRLVQTRAESEFLRCRSQQFNDEIDFYTLKNQVLQTRQFKIRYELDEELFAIQTLRMEFEILENEKITNEDMHLTSIDDARGSIDMSQITAIQPSNYYREQLNHQVQQIRTEYEKKIQTYRDELHRKFELEFHRYQMYKSRPIPMVTREHKHKLDQLKSERRTTEEQITSVRDSITKIQNQIGILDTQIVDIRPTSNSQENLAMLEQTIREREKQLDYVIRIRTELKQRIEKYRKEVDRYSKQPIEQSPVSTREKSIIRSSSTHDFTIGNYQQYQLSPSIYSLNSISLPSKQLAITQSGEKPLEEETFVRFSDFDVEQDCRELYNLLNQAYIDEVAIIKILCNRSVAQRLHIRDIYMNLFNQNLGNVIETRITGDSRKILQILLLSSVERECYELRRILKGTNINENIIIEIFLSHSNKHIKSIISYYAKLFNSTLAQDIIGDRETSSRRIFLALLQANRPENDEIDEDEVLNDARNLHESNSTWRIDGSTFIRLLCNRTNAHLKQTFDAYQKFNGIDIEQSIKRDTDTDLSRTLMTIVRITRNPARFYAYELRKSLKGSSTNPDNLIRIIVSRCEIDMVQIKSEYEKITNRTLFDDIQTDTNGNYKRALLELLRQRIQPINKELSFKQLLEPPELPKKNRLIVQWKQPLYQKSTGRSISSRGGNYTKQFDSDNQAKSTTLLAINTKRARPQYIERDTIDKRLNSNENHDE